MSDGIGNNDQQASNQSNQVSGTRKLRQGPVRTESASSSSSFDSCSDLLGSLENAEENLDVLSSLHDTDCREFEPKDDDNCHQASLQSEGVLAKAPFEQCERSVTEEALLDPEVKDEGVMMQSTAVKDHVYGFSNAISFSTVKFLAENTVERISQLQTSFRLPTSYIFSSKNLPQTDDTQNSDVQTGAETEASNIHKEHLLEKESHLREAGDNLENAERKAFMETNTFSPKQSGDVLPITHKDATSKSNILDDTHAGGFLFKEKPNALEEGLNRVFSENSLNLEDINDATTLIEDDVQISNVSTSNIVPMVFKNNTNSIVTADASSRGSEAEKSKLSDPDREANREGLQSLVEQVLKEDSGSQRIQGPIPSSDFCTKSPTFCHPLRSLSSGSGRPDLEEVDDEQNMAWGMLPNGPLVDLFDTAPVSTETLLNVEAHLGVNNEADIHKGINLDNDAHTGSLYQSSGVQNTGSFTPSCSNQGRGLTSSGQPTLAESVDRANSECTQGLLLKEQASGDILHEDKWKGLSIRLQSKLENDQREQKNNLGPDELCRYVENLQLNETYVDTVLDMEDVLLNGDEHGIRERFLLGSSSSVIGTPRSSRDGSLSSSTSGLQLFTLAESTPFTVDWVEVVGAKQRRGGSSFGERIVGVKDHTVYCIKVSSGNQEWEVLRRYRDFVDLYHQLRRKFNARTKKSLPSPWREVDRDSRKIFGSTHPNVVEVRSSRIENCLQSLLQAGPPFSTSSSLCWFLRPQSSVMGSSFSESNYWTSAAASQRSDVQLGSIESPYLQSPQSELEGHKGELDYNKSSVSLGKTVKLNLKTHPRKNTKQLLSSQHYSCAGCYKHLEAERGLMHGFVQTLGWGKPRLCEYSGQLYCTSCHLNETAVLPAQVLWHWDFTPRRVSQLAKAYLDSIYDQPMLCVSAVNPYLYSRVPILSHVKETRRKLNKLLACIVCPGRARILQKMGSRRYLMENNDFFALQDLEDLSKGAFAVLPSVLKNVLDTLKMHIMKQCSVCSEAGEWCGAGVLCEEPFSPIFPFEEENITNCKVCHAPFHKACFSKLSACPACRGDQSNKSVMAGVSDTFQTEELAENIRDVTLLLGGEDGNASSSLAGGADLQGGFELDRQSHTRKNWPSFYSLLPKPRLW